jgi:hypothetical protein
MPCAYRQIISFIISLEAFSVLRIIGREVRATEFENCGRLIVGV